MALDFDAVFIIEWLRFLARWIHVIAAMAWIGASFFFIALDLGLRPAKDMPKGAYGDDWHVHGGGFYHMRKYLVAPEAMPEHLVWHKWQCYTTWLSGAALLMLIYWVGGEIYLLEPARANISLWEGIAISGGSLAFGWLFYDRLCKSRLGERPTTLMMILFLLLVAMSWGYNQVFTGRAALVHLGAFTATIMAANVFFQIIPNQRIVVADLKAGRKPDPKYGKIGKLRSTHNNYLTLPVIFLMLSIHYPLAFGTQYSWLIACLIFVCGATIRHYFNTLHASPDENPSGPKWTWGVTAGVLLLIVFLSMLGRDDLTRTEQARAPAEDEKQFIQHANFEEVKDVVTVYCALCHARQPLWGGISGIPTAPNAIYLETPADIARNARVIYLQAGLTRGMPPPGAVEMSADEREIIVNWYRDVRDKVAAEKEAQKAERKAIKKAAKNKTAENSGH